MLRRYVVVGAVALTLAAAGCARAVEGSGRLVHRLAPAAAVVAEPTATAAPGQSPTPTGEPTEPTEPAESSATAADGTTAEPAEPAADVARGEAWRYADGLRIAVVGVVPYAGTPAVGSDEYALRLTYEVTNGASAAVNLAKWTVEGDCVGGATMVDADDDSLSGPTGKLAAGAAATYESGMMLEQSARGQRCTVRITPSAAYEPARFVFTAPHG